MQRLAYFLPENIGKRLSIDETSSSNGGRTLYYFNQQSSKGKKGTIVAGDCELKLRLS
jgi:hypothetical protein